MQRASRQTEGAALDVGYCAVPRRPAASGITFSGANVTMLDGYDINMATMVRNCTYGVQACMRRA